MIGAAETSRIRYRGEGADDARGGTSRAKDSRKERGAHPRAQQASRQARRVSAAKRDERERRRRIMRARRIVSTIALISMTIALCLGLSALAELPVFDIERVIVEGASHLTPEQVETAARVPMGSSLLKLRTGLVAERVRRDPWVESVVVDRDLPGTVRIIITERRPIAVIDLGGEDLWVCSSDGIWLGRFGSHDATLPVVRDVSMESPKAGTKVTSTEIRNAVALIQGLSEELLLRTAYLSAASVDKTSLVTTDSVEIFFGSATDVEKKDRIAREILSKAKGKVVYINVRVVESPTWRGLDH